MPKYQVLQPIEKQNVLYVPSGTVGQKEAPSGGHGKSIPVNASGEIELTEQEASVLIHGQVPLVDGKPDHIGGAEAREKNAREDAKKAAAKAAAEKAEYEEFVAFRAAKAARKEKAKDTAQEKAEVAAQEEAEDAAQEEAEDRADEDAAAAKDEAKAAKAKKEKK